MLLYHGLISSVYKLKGIYAFNYLSFDCAQDEKKKNLTVLTRNTYKL